MDAEHDEAMAKVLGEALHQIFWTIRKEVELFPDAIRITVRVGIAGSRSAYFTEHEMKMDPAQLEKAEQDWQEFLRVSALEQAKDILEHGDEEGE